MVRDTPAPRTKVWCRSGGAATDHPANSTMVGPRPRLASWPLALGTSVLVASCESAAPVLSAGAPPNKTTGHHALRHCELRPPLRQCKSQEAANSLPLPSLLATTDDTANVLLCSSTCVLHRSRLSFCPPIPCHLKKTSEHHHRRFCYKCQHHRWGK